MNQNILIIDGHPDPDPERFCHALANAYAEGASEAGHQVRTVSAAILDIPLLRTAGEFTTGTVSGDMKKVQEDISWADHLLIIYPLWLGTMPALLKALFEQVMRPGFALNLDETLWGEKPLKGKSARIVVTMGMPALVYRWFYGEHSVRNLERNILKFCGISPVRETLIGMVENSNDEKRAGWLMQMSKLGAKAR